MKCHLAVSIAASDDFFLHGGKGKKKTLLQFFFILLPKLHLYYINTLVLGFSKSNESKLKSFSLCLTLSVSSLSRLKKDITKISLKIRCARFTHVATDASSNCLALISPWGITSLYVIQEPC